MKHFTKQSSTICSLHGKIGIQMKNTVYTSKEKNYEFSSKKTFTICYYCLIFCGDFTFSISFSEDKRSKKRPQRTCEI